MHGAPSLMVLTIWMQISEKKTAEGCSAAWQRSVILRVSRAHAADGPDRPAIYANFNDIFRFPNNYYCFSRFSRPRANPMPESYDRPTRGRSKYIHTYIHILFYFRSLPPPPTTNGDTEVRAASEGSIIIELRVHSPSAATMNMLIKLPTTSFVRCSVVYILLYSTQTRIYIYYVLLYILYSTSL